MGANAVELADCLRMAIMLFEKKRDETAVLRDTMIDARVELTAAFDAFAAAEGLSMMETIRASGSDVEAAGIDALPSVGLDDDDLLGGRFTETPARGWPVK